MNIVCVLFMIERFVSLEHSFRFINIIFWFCWQFNLWKIHFNSLHKCSFCFNRFSTYLYQLKIIINRKSKKKKNQHSKCSTSLHIVTQMWNTSYGNKIRCSMCLFYCFLYCSAANDDFFLYTLNGWTTTTITTKNTEHIINRFLCNTYIYNSSIL